jgi:peroxiredoxin
MQPAVDAYNAVSVDQVVPAATLPGMPAVGAPAPDFTYQSHDMLWQNLHDMLEQGSVLLVFGANDEQLRQIEHEREALLRQGVVPVVVQDRRDHDVWATVRRLNLNYSLLADPHCVLSEQYGVLDRTSRQEQSAWFVVDRSGHVRGSGTGSLPSQDWTGLTAGLLGQPDANTLRSASAE